MAKVKVEVLDAIVDGKTKGEQLSIEDKDAARLETIGYIKRVAAPKKKEDPKETK